MKKELEEFDKVMQHDIFDSHVELSEAIIAKDQAVLEGNKQAILKAQILIREIQEHMRP